MKLSDKKSIQQLVLTMAGLGLENVIISPGSRNAPLTISFHQHGGFLCKSIRDERSAGFFALGKAIELQKPVALLCTSGSALLNYAPAIVEAYYQRVPLIVITADRPSQWIGQQDAQSIQQDNIYQNYIRKSYTLDGDTTDEEKLWYNTRCINEGFAIATQINPGPVHFNIPLSEPLYHSVESDSFKPKIIRNVSIKNTLEEKEIHELQSIFSQSKKVMILAGQQMPDAEINALLVRLSDFQNTIILCETTSNIHHPDFIENIDRCLVSIHKDDEKYFMPDLLITIGDAIVSKKIKAILRKNKTVETWNVHPHDAFVDSYQSLTRAIPMTTKAFLNQFLDKLSFDGVSDFKKRWTQRSSLLEKKHDQFILQSTYSDLWVFSKIYPKIPENTSLHFSNSSPIRYAQLFNNNHIKSVHCNRGVSGIDGCTSTAMGAASAHPHQNYLLITGDVAFFYDKNAFWNNNPPENLKIILINNSGGGIFRIIEGPSKTEELEDFFETKHATSAKKLVEFYEWNYLSSSDEASLEPALEAFFDTKNSRVVLEIFTPNQVNPEVLASYFKYLENNSEN